MGGNKPQIVQRLLPLTIMILAVGFLMGDFCEDVFSIPLEIEHQTDEITLTVRFAPAADGDSDSETPTDGDMDFDGEVPEAENPNFDPETGEYRLTPSHLTIDFSESAGGTNLEKYRGNLVGVFVRSVEYTILQNTIPADLPPLDIYLTPLVQGDDSDSFDWKSAIESGEFDTFELKELGVGDKGLVKLGQTKRAYFGDPVPDFPSKERLVEKALPANIDEISNTILSNFKFEAVINASDSILVPEENYNLLPETGEVQLQLRLMVVVIAKA